MKEIIILTIISGLAFLLFLVILILRLTKKNKKLKLTALILFLAFIGFTSWTAFSFISKTDSKVTETLRPRTGDEIYDALFDKRQTNCIKILNYQDKIVPKIDYAIWLHFETCPKELERILSRHKFTAGKLPTDTWDGKIPYGETLDWFNPITLGDTIMVYEYSTNDSRNIQTIWTNFDSTKVFVRDICN
jgi:hypothetical protein